MALNVGRVSRTAWLLWLLLALFVLRVVGQVVVQIWQPRWLPPSEEWYSGVVPYGRLLVVQFVLIAVHGLVCWQVFKQKGWLYTPKRWLGMALMIWGSLYLFVMVTRYIVRMSLYAPERWTGGAIPIFFHCVLATFALVLGAYHLRHSARAAGIRTGWKWRVAAGSWP